MIIKDEEVEKACNFMRDNAALYGKAKAERIYFEQFRKTIKALKMKDAEGTDKTRESEAYSHPEYVANLEALKLAVEREETTKWMMIAAQAKVEVWRTEQANNRAIDRSHQ
jgi:hypothetical protein